MSELLYRKCRECLPYDECDCTNGYREVEPCEHGNVYPHVIAWQNTILTSIGKLPIWCPGTEPEASND